VNEQARDDQVKVEASDVGRTGYRLSVPLLINRHLPEGMTSLGLGSGGEQNAPLGRAVIGGLTIASLFTLFFVPVVYKLLKRNFKPRALHPRLGSRPEEENHAPALAS
jgi:hypothetical protein